MRVIEDDWRREGLPRGGVGTVGNFDGVHLGQRVVIATAVDRARELGVPAVVVTFEPHPLTLLRPEAAPPRLVTAAQKERLLADCGVDAMLVVRFDERFAATPAERFARHFLLDRLDLVEIFVGRRFVFGRDREGDLALLQRLAGERGRRAAGVDEVSVDGERVSSTRIRAAVRSGDVGLAARLLGRAYELTGRIESGAGKGKGLGWPTINLAVENELVPRSGVYVTRVEVDGGSLPAVTNVGFRPTLHEGGELVVETHILDFDGDLYGRKVGLRFDHRLRDERRFDGVEELVAQIGRDVDRAREYSRLQRSG